MHRRTWVWAIAALLAFVSPLHAQTALDRLEDRLRERENVEELPPPVEAEPGYLGAITDDRQDRGRGVRIVEVVADGPAAAAGLSAGDLIVAVENQPVRRMADLAAVIQTAAAGDRLTLGVSREGETQDIAVTLGRRPAAAGRRFDEFGRVPEDDAAADAVPPDEAGGRAVPPRPAPADEVPPPPPPRLGITTRAVSAEARRLLDLPNNRGALVTEVVVGSPAHRAGIPLQSMIVSIGGLVVRNPNELGEALTLVEPGDEIEIAYYRGPTLHTVTLALDDLPAEAAQAGDEPAEAAPQPGPRPAAPQDVEDPAEEDGRLRALEERVEELQRRIEELERLLTDAQA